MRFTSAAFVLTCIAALPQSIHHGINGNVLDEDGKGIEGVLIVASGAGVDGLATSAADGSFHLKAAGVFLSVRHHDYKPQLINLADMVEPASIRLKLVDGTERKLPVCRGSQAWIGGVLKVNRGRLQMKGPVYGEHDSHWYVTFHENTLHIVDGYASHTGLPRESILTASSNVTVRSWTFGNQVGLDLSGQTKDGKRWRWFGAQIASAIEYDNATQEAATHFDQIIKSACITIR